MYILIVMEVKRKSAYTHIRICPFAVIYVIYRRVLYIYYIRWYIPSGNGTDVLFLQFYVCYTYHHSSTLVLLL